MAPVPPAEQAAAPASPRSDGGTDSPGSIFLRFLRFGALAWGGPAAQIARLEQECVEEQGWVSKEGFRKILAVYQVLPGPEAAELCVYFGRLRAGKLGGLAAGLGFALPGFVLMFAFSILYVEADLAENLDELFYGLKAAVCAVVARAVVRLGRSFLTDVPLALLAVASFVLTLLAPTGFLLVLGGAGLAYGVLRGAGVARSRIHSISPVPLVALIAVGAPALAVGAELFLEGLKAGLLTFGGAFTVVPFLQESAVEVHGWLTEDEFLDGLAIGGVLPAPLVIFSTFVGYLTGGLGGGLAMTVGIFLPAFVFPIFLHRYLIGAAENPHLRPFLLGVTAAVVGLIAAVTVEIVQAGVVDVPTAILAIAAFAALNVFHARLTVLYVILGCGAIGAALQLAGS